MSDVIEVSRRSKRSETHHGAPRDPVLVLTIIEWHDKFKRTFADIGKDLSMTRANVRDLYFRWYDWSQEPNVVEMAKTLIKPMG